MTPTVRASADPEALPPGAGRQTGYWGEALREIRRDPIALVGLALVGVLLIVAILAPMIAPYDPTLQHREGLSVDGVPRSTGADGFPLGTDGRGRDELSRLIDATRVSLLVGVGANLIAAAVGLVVGGFAGMAGRRTQTLVMRLVDIVLGFPILLLAITLLAVTDPSARTITLIIGLSFGAYLSRLVFAQVTSLREREFVLAARTGASGRRGSSCATSSHTCFPACWSSARSAWLRRYNWRRRSRTSASASRRRRPRGAT